MEIDASVRSFVERQRVARLGTVDAAGRPHVVPVTFALLGDRVYWAVDEKPKTTTRLKRLRNIEANPRVTLLFDEYDDDWTRLAWVMLRGVARAVVDEQERAEAIAALRARYAQYAAMRLEERPLVRIDVETTTRWGAVAGR